MQKLKIKKYRFLYEDWPAIIEKEYTQKCIHNDVFSGKLAKIAIKQVSEPQYWEYFGEKLLICDTNMTWIIAAPDNAHYSLMFVLDAALEPVAWYIDLIEDTGVDTDGIYYFEDLFLDIVIYPDGRMLEDDADELQTALAENVITQEQYDRTVQIARQIETWVRNDWEQFKQDCGALVSLI